MRTIQEHEMVAISGGESSSFGPGGCIPPFDPPIIWDPYPLPPIVYTDPTPPVIIIIIGQPPYNDPIIVNV